MYLGYQNGKIKFYTEAPLNTNRYNLDRVEETQEEYAYDEELQEYVPKDTEWEEKQLVKLKNEKYTEAKEKAYMYLESGEALYEFEEGKHIEATDGNIGKFTAYALGFMSGSTSPVVWSTKEDETVLLNAEQVTDILQGLGAVQAQVWTVKFTDYVTEINEAETIEEVQNIIIDYSQEIEGDIEQESEETENELQ